MLPGKQYKPEDILQILRRRIWIVLVPFAFVAAVTAVVAYFVVEVIGSLFVAWWWSTRPSPSSRPAVAAA